MKKTLAPLLFCFCSAWAASGDRQATPQNHRGRHLVVCLDGVNYEDFRLLQSRGKFAAFRPASRLIAPFPSLTNPAMTLILRPDGAPTANGYEDRYYSLSRSRMEGGVLTRFTPEFVEGSFRRNFDFHPPGFLSAFEYAVPPLSCDLFTRLDLKRSLAKFGKSQESPYLAYIGPTDCAAHAGGVRSSFRLLELVDREIDRLLREDPELRITLFSDHGNAYARYRRVDLGKTLRAGGYRVASNLGKPKNVVIPSYGLIGAAALYVDPSEAEAVARLAARADGVHFSACKIDGVVKIFTRDGEASIERRGDELFYLPRTADPLGLEAPAAGSRAEWFEWTREHDYPDAVNRVWERSQDAVLNRAEVLVGLLPGRYAGSRVLDLFVALKATHGSLDANQSLGFLATNGAEIPEFVASQDAWGWILGEAGGIDHLTP